MLTGLFGLSTTGTIALLMAILVIVYLFFRALNHLLEAIVTGIIFMAVPFILNAGGANVGTDFKTLVWFMIFGIIVFFIAHSVKMGYKAVNFITGPLGKKFKKNKTGKQP